MEALTPAERRGALMVVFLLALGAGHDLWRATRPLPAPGDEGPPIAGALPVAPSSEATPESTAGPPAAGRPAPRSIDLNRATAEELDALPGIGPVIAARIVDYRARNGPFLSPEELMAVRGVGPRLFARLSPFIRGGNRPRPVGADSLGGPP